MKTYMKCALLLTIFVCSVNLAAVKKVKRAADFGNESFLKNTVDIPRVHQGSGQVHKVSGTIPHGRREDDKNLDRLLRQIFGKIVSYSGKNSVGVVSSDDVKIADSGVAYKNPNRIPTQEKRESSSQKPYIDDSGIAHRIQDRIPTTYEKRGDATGTLSLKEITESVDKLINALASRNPYDIKNTKKTKSDDTDERKFKKFKEVDSDETPTSNLMNSITDKSNQVIGYNEFKDKFFKIFLKSDAQRKTISTDQNLINTGKDNGQQNLINTGKDTFHHINNVESDHRDNEVIDEVEKKRLDKLYEELKTQTKEETKRIEKLQRKKRLESVKRDILDLLNGIQHRETFTYDGEKFGVSSKKDASGPMIINTGKDNRIKANVVPEKQDSRLNTVELLIKQLRDLDEKKKKEVNTVDNSNYGKLYKKETNTNDQKRQEDSASRMEKIFLDSFETSSENRMKTAKKEAVSVKKEALTVKKEAAPEKKEATQIERKRELRGMLVGLMDELDKRIATDKKITQDDQTKRVAQSSDKRFENELENIVTSIDDKKKQPWSTDEATQKALEGFNIHKDSLIRDRKQTQKTTRP